MKQIVLNISAKDYAIKLDEDFALVFQKDIQNFLDNKTKVSAKELLTAFVQKCHESYLQEKELQKILKNINENDTI